MNTKRQFMDGLIHQNPVLVQLLGMCSTLAITTSFFNGLGMGISVTVILTLSNSLGVFIPLIVVNCIILGRAEAFASKNGVGAAAVDGICQGIGYTLVLVIMCVFRELLGAGTFGAGLLGGGELGAAPGLRIIPEQFGIKILTMPVGGFLTLGALIAAMQWALSKSEKKKKEAK